MLRDMLVYAFGNEKKWRSYSPFEILKKVKKPPKIVITKTDKELDGFNKNISDFISFLKNKKIDFSFFKANGNHNYFSVNNGFRKFIKNISMESSY
jgi:hypothetical protein